jgi:hypothetical protein
MGTSAVSPKVPADKSDRTQQLIATLISPPYTASASDVKVRYSDYSRYTMKNIGSIDSRLTALEKRVKRQGIDIAALNNKVFDRDGIQGNVLYTTGIFVEDFSNHSASLTTSPGFTATINTVKKECRPAVSAVQHKLFFISDPDVSYRDDLITMPYDEQVLTGQTVPTGFTQVNPSGTLQSSGSSSIFPLALAAAGYYAWSSSTSAATADLAAGYIEGVLGDQAITQAVSEAVLSGGVELGIGVVDGLLTDAAIDYAIEVAAAEGLAIVAEATLWESVIAVGAEIFAFFFSDVRVKENINKVGEVDGMNVYTYNYKWDKTQQYSGVMANELLGTTYADAVMIHKSGYYMVDYGKYETLRKIKGI